MLSRERLEELAQVRGLSSTASDVLDELGYVLAVPASVLVPRVAPSGPAVAGYAVTLRYLPERKSPAEIQKEPTSGPRLPTGRVFEMADPGDVVVIDAAGGAPISALGGLAAVRARRVGLAAVIVDGGVRDLADIDELGLPLWSRELTPVTGNWRLGEAMINVPISCGGVQVRPRDLVVADETGICFVPEEVADRVADRILELARDDEAQFRKAVEGLEQ